MISPVAALEVFARRRPRKPTFVIMIAVPLLVAANAWRTRQVVLSLTPGCGEAIEGSYWETWISGMPLPAEEQRKIVIQFASSRLPSALVTAPVPVLWVTSDGRFRTMYCCMHVVS